MPSLTDQALLLDEGTADEDFRDRDPARSLAAATSDAELLARLRAGDTAAFAAVVDAWSPVMLSVARRYVHDRQAAEDVVQDAWLGVLSGIARFEGRSSVRSWVFSILINRAKSRWSRDARVECSADPTGGEPDGPTVDPSRFQGPDGAYPGHWTSTGAPRPWEQPERRLLDREVGGLLGRALAELPERQRIVVQMRDVHGMSAEETCAALQLSPGNQRVLLHRGRAALRALLEDYYRG
ncbi:sigma-70 family RNA polymerase sigma factor [Geodermatophilus sp. YIM 151500]|uniref:RNA polymerase sigma factor n=1 Tax=Geodermatophilus sp. YIM 151500 TaxID=2984531 RepID=UPI0021E4B61B|nr:sigma-70 family RNA polymerase sigma factor [Geodermatophilus sp. YIM 151500]MCV2491948.1 sigma-70 family RNA polymerase sigma factor [Geodermatophilus sp. YIM 151500]